MNSFISSSDTFVTDTESIETQPLCYRRYLLWTSLSLIVMVATIFAFIALKGEELPPPPFTGSISFDEKALWLSQRLDAPCDILAIGSSMTLNNLHGDSFAGEHLLNTASWGLKVQQTEAFLDLTLRYVSPETIVMLTTPVDFEHDYRGAKIYDRDLLQSFFDTQNLFQAHLKTLSLKYLASEYNDIREDRHGRQTYYSLDFDTTGSVPLAKNNFQRIEKRWNDPLTTGAGIDEANYKALARIAQRCQKSGIDFILIQPPIREDIIRPSDREFLASHWKRLQKACTDHQQTYLNLHGKLAIDSSDFADATHLNESGAKILSDYLHEKVINHRFSTAP